MLLLLGGAVLGHGKEESIVVTPDELPKLLPGTHRWCAYMCDPKKGRVTSIDCVEVRHARGTAKWRHFQTIIDPASVAIKLIRNGEPANEIYMNTLVRKWFRSNHVDRDRLTTLHPDIDRIDVFHHVGQRKNLVKTTMMVMQKRAGDMSSFMRASARAKNMDLSETRRVVINMARRVLEFLVVAHRHGYMHMDIKPKNILYHSHNMDAMDFCLADYGDMFDVPTVLRELTGSASTRDSLSLSIGTDGYMSPLLKRAGDDAHNGVYRYFRLMTELGADGQQTGGGPPSNGLKTSKSMSIDRMSKAAWAQMFAAAKKVIKKWYPKVDMHSLAFTILKCIDIVHEADTMLTMPENADLRSFITHLMFFRSGVDFASTEEALAFVNDMNID